MLNSALLVLLVHSPSTREFSQRHPLITGSMPDLDDCCSFTLLVSVKWCCFKLECILRVQTTFCTTNYCTGCRCEDMA